MNSPNEPASDRASAALVAHEGAVAVRLRTPDGVESYLPFEHAQRLMFNEQTRTQVRHLLLNAPVPYRVRDGE
jgi:hypothetical protein